MISLPENVLHDFRAVARRAGRNARLQQSALFHLQSGKDGVRIQTLNECTRIEYHHSTPAASASLVLPMSLMADCQAKENSDVEFQPHVNGNVDVRWERATPLVRTFAHGSATPERFPVWPTRSASKIGRAHV